MTIDTGMSIEMGHPRSRFLAALFNLFAPGLGFLYLNRLWLTIGWPILMLLPFAVMAWSKFIFTAAGMWLVVILIPLLWIASIVIGVVIAHRNRHQTLSRYQRWYFYITFLLLSVGLNHLLTTYRGDIFGYESFRLPSGSMQPTLQPDDYINADTWYYQTREPSRGDIIVFRYPPDPRTRYIKRVIGLPGDSMELKGGEIYINGELLDEPYIRSEFNTHATLHTRQFVVPEDSFFVLGDNRDRSNDSRNWGFLPAENIEGRGELIWFSFGSDGIRSERIGKRLK